jgi:hypothetical protein
VVEDLENGSSTSEQHCIQKYETFVAKYGPLLAPTHHQLIDVKHTLTQMYGNAEGYGVDEMSKEQLQKMEKLCREVLDVANILTPGECHVSRLPKDL